MHNIIHYFIFHCTYTFNFYIYYVIWFEIYLGVNGRITFLSKSNRALAHISGSTPNPSSSPRLPSSTQILQTRVFSSYSYKYSCFCLELLSIFSRHTKKARYSLSNLKLYQRGKFFLLPLSFLKSSGLGILKSLSVNRTYAV